MTMSSDAIIGTRGSGPRAWPRAWLDWMSGRRGRWRQVVLWTLVALVALRLVTPLILTRLANQALAEGEEVRGSISGLSLSLLAGNYTVHDLELRSRRDDGRWRPMLKIERIQCNLAWGPLLRGALSGHLTVHQPELELFAEEKSPTIEELPVPLERPPANQPATLPWQDAIQTVVRVRLTAIDIIDGRIRFHDERRQLEVELVQIAGQVENLTIPESAITHRCPFHFTAVTPGHGGLRLDGEADILAKSPTFLVRTQLEHVLLPELNPLTRTFGNLTFADGTFQGYAEIVSDGRRLGGYLKVLFHRLDIRSFGDSDPATGTTSFLGVLVKVAENILENSELQQHAARFPISGPLERLDTDVWTAIGTALRNAFVRAMVPGFAGPAGK